MDAICILTNKESDLIVEEYNKLKLNLDKDKYDVFLIYNTENKISDKYKNLNYYIFKTSDLFNMGVNLFVYKNNITLWGNSHLPIIKLNNEYKKYDNYWYLEDDVKFSGNWDVFFKSYEQNKSDLITSFLYNKKEKNEWRWWRETKLLYNIPDENRYKGFFPIFRISNSGINFLYNQLKIGWYGHMEEIISTILYNGGYKLYDIKNEKFCIDEFYNWKCIRGDLYNVSNILYHPVKNF